MLRHIDGFDHYGATTEIAANITSILEAAGYTVNNATNTTFNIAAGQDQGSLGLKMTIPANSATPPSFSRSFTTVEDYVCFGFSFRGTQARQRFARIAGVLDLDWDPTTGKMKVGEVLGQDVIILNAFWSIEIEIDKVNNEFRAWANDTLQLTVPLPGAVGNTHTIVWGMNQQTPTASVVEIDDLYIIDSAGGKNNSRLGPLNIVTRRPTADVVAEWTAVGSTAAHNVILSQQSPAAANAPYVQANVEGRTDRFTSNVVLPNSNEIVGVALTAYARKGDLDNRNLGLQIGTQAGVTETQIPLNTAYGFKQAIFETAPNGETWDQNRVETSSMAIIAR